MIRFFHPGLQVFDFKGPLQTFQLVFLLLFLVLYFLPCGIAGARKAKGGCLIFIVNLIFGWTIIGWFAALAMAVTAGSKRDGGTDLTRRG